MKIKKKIKNPLYIIGFIMVLVSGIDIVNNEPINAAIGIIGLLILFLLCIRRKDNLFSNFSSY